MHLSDFFTPGAWAILPHALEAFFQSLLGGITPGSEHGPVPQAASSASGDGPPSGYLYAQVEGIAFINVRGVIARRGGSVSFFGMTFSWEGQDTIRAAIAMAMQDPDVKAVLLSFDSPGGTAAGVKELADFIAAQTAKPVYAYADGLCASAAYWLATATGRVYAPLTAEVGSIGVIAAHVDRSAANAARGIRVTYITGGAYKAAGNPDSPLSASDQSYLQEIVSKLHAVFRDDVAAHMPVDAADPKAWGDGQIFLADTALELGLLTGIVTDMDELLVLIKKEIHMDKEELAKKHPELLARIQAEARAEAETAMKAEHEKALAATAVSTAALVKAVVGDEAAAKVSALAEAGFTAAQIEVLGGLIAPAFGLIVPAPQAAPEANTESEGRKEMLELLRKASPAPVNTSVAPRGGDAVQAAIDQISAVRA